MRTIYGISESFSLVKIRIILHVLDGKTVDTIVPKDSFTIGRSLKCDVSVPSEGISRTHCMIELLDGEFYITDLGSANGVVIDEVKIPPDTKTKFLTTSTIYFGNVEVQQLSFQEELTLELETRDYPPEKRVSPQQVRESAPRAPRASKAKVDIHPGLKGMLLVMIMAAGYFFYTQFLAPRQSESDALDQALYEANMKNRKNDGTVKTRNF